MASKVLVPPSPFSKLQVKKSPGEAPGGGGGGLVAGGAEPAARIAHLEHSVRFLQEQHRLMLNGLHAEIEALRERNRDLQFQLLFNKESSLKTPSPSSEEGSDTAEDATLKQDIKRLEKELEAAKSEARATEARALELQQLVDTQTQKLQALELERSAAGCTSAPGAGCAEAGRAELRARLAEAERLVRRLRADERRRGEVLRAGAATNLLFDAAAARHAHLQCMKNSLHASLRGAALDGFGYQNTYHFPPVRPAPDFWREPSRDEVEWGRGARRSFALPELATSPTHARSTVYVNHHTRPRANGYENKHKKSQGSNGDQQTNGKSPEELLVSPAPESSSRRPRRHHHRKLTDHT